MNGNRSIRFAAAAAALIGWGAMARAAEPEAGDAPAWRPKLYAFCVGLPQVKNPSIPQQARMLRQLGFDGVGYPLWLDDNLEANLKALDDAGLEVYLMYFPVRVDPSRPAFDPRVPAAMGHLRGRPVTLSVLLQGLPPGDPRGYEPAVRVLRQLGDLAANCGLRISIYHHTGDWTASLLDAIRVAEKTGHPQVGVNFNLCHWLMVDGDKDYRPVLREHAEKIFAVTINGAQRGAKTWTNGLIQPLDQGDFDNRALLETLRQAGYRGPVGLMCYGIPGEPREHLQRSMAVWKGWMARWPAR